MALSRSTLGFGLVTVAAFGMAGYETLCKPAPAANADRSLEEMMAAQEAADGARLEAAAAQEAAEADEEAARAKARLAKLQAELPSLLGASPATLGTAFAGVELGAPTSRALHDQLRTMDSDDIVVGTNAGAEINRIFLAAEDRDTCAALEGYLAGVWGDGVWGDRAWASESPAQRAQLTDFGGTCRLDIERFVAVDRWVAPRATGAAARATTVPLWAVGRPLRELDAWLDARKSVETGDRSDEAISWADLGTGPRGSGRTELTAYLRDGVVVAIEATLNGQPSESPAIAARLERELGKGVEGEDRTVWAKARPPIALVIEGEGLELAAGSLP